MNGDFCCAFLGKHPLFQQSLKGSSRHPTRTRNIMRVALALHRTIVLSLALILPALILPAGAQAASHHHAWAHRHHLSMAGHHGRHGRAHMQAAAYHHRHGHHHKTAAL